MSCNMYTTCIPDILFLQLYICLVHIREKYLSLVHIQHLCSAVAVHM